MTRYLKKVSWRKVMSLQFFFKKKCHTNTILLKDQLTLSLNIKCNPKFLNEMYQFVLCPFFEKYFNFHQNSNFFLWINTYWIGLLGIIIRISNYVIYCNWNYTLLIKIKCKPNLNWNFAQKWCKIQCLNRFFFYRFLYICYMLS